MKVNFAALVFLTSLADLLLISPVFAAGWYLMTPPTSGELDTSCATDRTLPAIQDLLGALIAWDSAHAIWMRRCDLERKDVKIATPVWQWNLVLETKTLDECHAGYKQAQKEERLEEARSKGVAKLELLDEGYANASDEDLKSRIASLKATVDLQYRAAECIATDDPRLKKDNYDAEGDL
jgi:hypothetical protein